MMRRVFYNYYILSDVYSFSSLMLLDCKISCLHYMFLSTVFDNHN